MTPTVAWWLASEHYRTHRGIPLDFESHRYLVGPLKDDARVVVAMKCTQVGFTEAMFCWAMSCAERGLNLLYVFPSDDVRNEHVSDRFDPVINEVPYFRTMLQRGATRTRKGEVQDARRLKHIGQASFAFVGSNTVSAFRSFVADAAVVEELDECDQDNLAKLDGRFGHSQHRFIRYVGNPSIEGFGIHAEYDESDQRVWMVACPSCRDRQPLDYFANVVREIDDGEFVVRSENPDDPRVVCRSCGAELDRYGPGEWIATYPTRSVSGYHVNKLMAGTIPVRELVDKHKRGLRNTSKLEAFFNDDLGLPFSTEGTKLSDRLIGRTIRGYAQQGNVVGAFGGVDVGALLHTWIIAPDGRSVWIKTYRSFDELDMLFDAYPGLSLVIDKLPETREAARFAVRHRQQGRDVYLCEYVEKRSDGRDFAVIDPDDWDQPAVVKAVRTVTMDGSHGDILRQSITLPRDARSIEDVFKHLAACVRKFNERTQSYQWLNSRPDHYRHALNYATIARDIRRESGGSFAFSLGRE